MQTSPITNREALPASDGSRYRDQKQNIGQSSGNPADEGKKGL